MACTGPSTNAYKTQARLYCTYHLVFTVAIRIYGMTLCSISGHKFVNTCIESKNVSYNRFYFICYKHHFKQKTTLSNLTHQRLKCKHFLEMNVILQRSNIIVNIIFHFFFFFNTNNTYKTYYCEKKQRNNGFSELSLIYHVQWYNIKKKI